jgi:hypothetical protein
MNDVPRLYRVLVEVADLDKASVFYSKLLDMEGRRVRGGRHYYDCGPVIVALVDVSLGGKQPQPLPGGLYFAVRELEKVHARARDLGCLSREKVHDEDGGDIVKRPWGERSFYAEDPFGNGLCFVDEQTLFTGK